jgi:hypothetical protein
VSAPPDYNSDQLFKSNLTFCVVCVFNMQFEKSVFLRRWFIHNRLINANFDAKFKKKHTFTYIFDRALSTCCMSQLSLLSNLNSNLSFNIFSDFVFFFKQTYLILQNGLLNRTKSMYDIHLL